MGNLYVKKKKEPAMQDSTLLNNVTQGATNPADNPKEPKIMPSSLAFRSDIQSSNLKVVVALHSYTARDDGDLSFVKGDRLGILDDSDADWWCACHLTLMTEGYFPCSYVAPEKTLECEDWFFGRVTRRDAEKMLLKTSNPRGTFLIRNNELTAGKWNDITEVAVKIVWPGTMAPSALLNEARIMKQFRHENLISLFAICSQEEPILIVTEYMANNNLLEYLRKTEGRNLKFHALIDFAAQVACGMAYLERNRFIHRNLAARNVLLNDDNFVKIADFGLAKIIEDSGNVDHREVIFHIKWTAPEAALLGQFTNKSDVYSYGILLHELITYGQIPYPGMTNSEVMKHVIKLGYRMPKPINYECPDSVYSMMLQCWDADSEKRPTFEFLFSFFDDYFIATEPIHGNAENFK